MSRSVSQDNGLGIFLTALPPRLAVAMIAVLVSVSLAAAQGGAPQVKVSADSLTFTEQLRGTTSGPRYVTITNVGTGPLTFARSCTTCEDLASITFSENSTSGEFSVTETYNCPRKLEPGRSCTVGVLFTPTEDGTRSATLDIKDDAPGSPQHVALSGTGASSLSRTRLSVRLYTGATAFGAQRSDAEARKLVVLHNSGREDVTITDVALVGADPKQFRLQKPSTCKETLPAHNGAGSVCVLDLYFEPKALGWWSAILRVTDNADDSPQELSFSGLGAPTPVAKLEPAKEVFVQPWGTKSSPHTITVSNAGTGPLVIGEVRIAKSDGLFEIASDKCRDASLAPGKACTFAVTYEGRAESDKGPVGNFAEISISDNTLPHKSHTLLLRGYGRRPK